MKMDKTFDLIDYKGKHFVIQDKGLLDDGMEYVIGEMTKKQILDEKDFIESHRDLCYYYGIPPYIGSDLDLIKALKQ